MKNAIIIAVLMLTTLVAQPSTATASDYLRVDCGSLNIGASQLQHYRSILRSNPKRANWLRHRTPISDTFINMEQAFRVGRGAEAMLNARMQVAGDIASRPIRRAHALGIMKRVSAAVIDMCDGYRISEMEAQKYGW